MVNWCFGDGFDLYASPNDALAGYWDGGSGAVNWSLQPGRFAGSRALQNNPNSTVIYLIKSSGSNDAIHHIVCAFQDTAALSGTNACMYFSLGDGATAQCSIVFRQDGAILLTSGGPTGTTLDTWTGAFSQNVWTAFEFEIVINNTTGAWAARKNGNTSNDHVLGSLNTRGGTANNYANRLSVGANITPANQLLDDLLWRSDSANVPWVGDIRCYTRMPASDVSTLFTRSLSSVVQSTGQSSSSPVSNTIARYIPLTAAYDGTVASVILSMATGYTGNMKCTIFAGPATAPTTILGSATPIVNPATGNNTFTFSTPVTVSRGTQYWIGFMSDTLSGSWNISPLATGVLQGGASYATFPTAFPATSGNNSGPNCSWTLTVASNATLVSEPQQDGVTSYIYDANPGDADFYTIAAAGATLASVVAVTTRGFAEKSDAGTRSGAVQLKSGATTTTWNPSDQLNTTLSGGNLTATFAGTTTNSAVRSIFGASSGKYYLEMRVNSPSNSSLGLALASVSLASIATIGTGSPVAGTVMFLGSGFVYVGTSLTANFGVSPVNGDIIQIAVDLSAKLIWFRLNAGNWNNSGTANPATGTGGFDISGVATAALYATCGGQQNAGVTANFGATAFAFSVPGGFNAGFGILGTTVASPTTPLSTSWSWLWRTDQTDPATSATWTSAAVNAALIGPVMVS